MVDEVSKLHRAVRRTRDVLGAADSMLGDRKFAEGFGQMRYGRFREDGSYEEGPVPFFSNQAAATMGRGVMMHPRTLPLYRLQNPVRQLYQRLGSGDTTRSGESVRFQEGDEMERRAQLHERSSNKLLFSGVGQATPRQRQIYGNYANERQHAVTSRVAFLPPDHKRIYESRGRTTLARSRAMEAKPEVRTETVDIGLPMEGKEKEQMEQWMKEQAEKRNIGGQGPLDQRLSEVQRRNLEEAYMLTTIREDDASGLTSKAKKMVDMSIEERLQRTKGFGRTDKNKMRKLLGKRREGDPDVVDVGGRTELFNPDRQNGIVKDPLLTPSNKRLLGLDSAIKRNDQGDPSQLVMQFIEDPGGTFKEFTMGAKVGQVSKVRRNQVGMHGEQAMMEAAFMKSSRRDFAGMPQSQVGRFYDRAIEELQRNATADAPSLEQRQQVIDRFARSLEKLTGGEMDKAAIKQDVIRENMGGKRFADYFEINYTDEFSQALEENVSTTRMMQASKEMGLTMRDVFERGSDMLKQFDPNIEDKKAKRQIAGQLLDQVENTLERVRTVDEPDIREEFGHIPSDVGEHMESQHVEDAIKKLQKQKQTLQKLYDGKIEDLSSTETQGSMYDLFVDSESGNVSTAFRVLTAGMNMQGSAVGGTGLGEDFESGVGRATKRKRSSMLTQALVGHSASNTLGALGQKEKMAEEVFRGWLSSQSGAAAFSSERFQREVFEALSSHGKIDAKDVFDPDRVREEDGAYVYEMPEGQDDVTLQEYVNKKFQWDAGEGSLKYVDDTGNTYQLNVSPFTTLRETERARAQVMGMVTGELKNTSVSGVPIGGDDRTLSLTFGEKTSVHEGRISAKDFHELFGKKTRAQQHFQHERGETPTPHQERAYDKRYVYFGQNAQPLTGVTNDLPNYTDTVFNEQFDFLEVRLFGDLTGTGEDVQMQEVADALKKSGVSEQMVSRTLMGDLAIKRATSQFVGDLDEQERERVEGMIDYLRKSNNDGGPGTSIYIPTKTGSERPTLETEDGVTRAGVGQWADLADKLDAQGRQAIGRMETAVQRIHETAQELKGQGIDIQNSRAAQQKLRQVFEREFSSAVESGDFLDVERFFAETLQKGARKLAKRMESYQGAYLGGEYKLSSPQVDMAETFGKLSGAFEEGGPSAQFRDQVRELVRTNNPDVAEANVGKFEDTVDKVAGDLHQYMKAQKEKFGDNFNRWRGLGVGEGFIARSKAEKVAEAMRTSHQGWERKLQKDAASGEPTNLQAKAQRRLQQISEEFDDLGGPLDASRTELALTQQEIDAPGTTPGVLAMNVRQPDFTATGGYEMSRLTALGDETIKSIGGDPEHIHTVSHPLASWSRKEDFDFDLNYMATIDDTVTSHLQRRTRAQSMPADLANLWQIMEEAGHFRGDPPGGPGISRFSGLFSGLQAPDLSDASARWRLRWGRMAEFRSFPKCTLHGVGIFAVSLHKPYIQAISIGLFWVYCTRIRVEISRRKSPGRIARRKVFSLRRTLV